LGLRRCCLHQRMSCGKKRSTPQAFLKEVRREGKRTCKNKWLRVTSRSWARLSNNKKSARAARWPGLHVPPPTPTPALRSHLGKASKGKNTMRLISFRARGSKG
jgi:hypothetical protein